MTHDDLKAWRKGLQLTQKEAADLLGVSLFTYGSYEKGRRLGDESRPSTIPKAIGWACAAIAAGLEPWGSKL